jgi:hypothetical protein
MRENSEFNCKHIALLPTIPSRDELTEHRTIVGKMKIPKFQANDNGGHAELGRFGVDLDGDFYFEWNLAGKDENRYGFSDLCERPDLEMQRLELGWLIGNIYRLNKLHDLERLGVPGDEASLKEHARLSDWYDKREMMWYRWAVASPRNRSKKK